MPILDEHGDLVATLMQVGNGRQVPRAWLVYWSLKHDSREKRQFPHRGDALAWMRQQFPQARAVKQ